MQNPDSLPLKLDILNRSRLRSFVTRQGRMTKAQKHAIETQWPKYGMALTDQAAWSRLWETYPSRVFEIGFGNGKSLVEMAANRPDELFIGVEVHQPGIGSLLIEAEKLELDNLRVCCADARDILTTQVPDNCLDRIQVFFPDPWPKKRHHKRRIIQADFLRLILPKLKYGGQLHCATDWQPYAEHMLECLVAEERFSNLYPQQGYAPRPNYRPLTKFEHRGQKLGHGVWDLIFEKSSS